MWARAYSIYANMRVSSLGSDSLFLRRSANGLNDSATDVSVDEIRNAKLRVFPAHTSAPFACHLHLLISLKKCRCLDDNTGNWRGRNSGQSLPLTFAMGNIYEECLMPRHFTKGFLMPGGAGKDLLGFHKMLLRDKFRGTKCNPGWGRSSKRSERAVYR